MRKIKNGETFVGVGKLTKYNCIRTQRMAAHNRYGSRCPQNVRKLLKKRSKSTPATLTHNFQLLDPRFALDDYIQLCSQKLLLQRTPQTT